MNSEKSFYALIVNLFVNALLAFEVFRHRIKINKYLI